MIVLLSDKMIRSGCGYETIMVCRLQVMGHKLQHFNNTTAGGLSPWKQNVSTTTRRTSAGTQQPQCQPVTSQHHTSDLMTSQWHHSIAPVTSWHHSDITASHQWPHESDLRVTSSVTSSEWHQQWPPQSDLTGRGADRLIVRSDIRLSDKTMKLKWIQSRERRVPETLKHSREPPHTWQQF